MKIKIDQPKKSTKKNANYKPIVPAVKQASRILICLGESPNPKMKLTEICKQVGIHNSRGHSILNTLIQFGFVEKNPQTKTYSLGPSLIFLSRNVLDNLYYPDIVAPFLEKLAEGTYATALFGLINGEYVFTIAKSHEDKNRAFVGQIGRRLDITLGAHGKAIVAFMPEVDRKKLLTRKKLYYYGDESRLNMKLLRDEITNCRRVGFAQDVGEITPGINVVSAPVFSLHEQIIGCIILIGTFPESMIEKYGSKTADIAKQVSYRLGADVETIFKNMNEKKL